MGNNLNKFALLLWKNWTLLKRQRISLAIEICYPLVVTFALVFIRGLPDVTQHEGQTYEPFRPNSGDFWTYSLTNNTIIGYSPRSPFLRNVLSSFSRMESEYDADSCANNKQLCILEFENATELDNAINKKHTVLTMALVFSDTLTGVTNSDDLVKNSPNLDVTIRLLSENRNHERANWYTNLLYSAFETTGPREYFSDTGGWPDYNSRGFLYLQQSIVSAIINNGTSIQPRLSVELRRYPNPKWVDDIFYSSTFEITVSIILMMSFMYNYINTIRSIAAEKEKQLKEFMKIMGLPGWLHWTAWFVRTLTILLVVIIIMVIVLKVEISQRPVFTHTDGTVLFFFLLLFGFSLVTFSFLVSVFFSKANTAAAVGGFLFLFAYLPYMLQQLQADTLSSGKVLASSLLSHSGLAFGLTLFLKFEAIEEGIQWSNIWSSVSPDENVSLGPIMMMFILDTFLYLVLALYIEVIFPGEFGVPQPWYFPFTRTYWSNKKQTPDYGAPVVHKSEFFEEFHGNIPIGIQLKNLSKTFGNNRVVNKVNLDMYEGHITVLIGHNGAGKTTTMSMITGMFAPSKGTAMVSGYDVRTNVDLVRANMGLCLQHNVLFDTLTVWEHLYFFGKLKGLQQNEIEQEIDKYIKLLGLEDKRHSPSSTLSGGTKRKLSLGIALCGKSKVLMLDEPTSGMDPSARRMVWDLLQKEKRGRTILLTTHFMDEADLLGDRIAIMTAGELQCCGSSFFLKHKYGAGYYLIMDVTPGCNPGNITELLGKHISYIKVHSHVGSELTYQLSEGDSEKFEGMLGDLERNFSKLGVQSYGMSLTTMEEVFLKVGTNHDSINHKNVNANNQNVENQILLETSNSKYLTKLSLMKNQFIAMVLKKWFAALRVWYLCLAQVVLPVVLLILTIVTNKSYVPSSTFPQLRISLDSYSDPITLLSGSSHYVTIHNQTLMGHQVVQVTDISSEILDLTTKATMLVKRHYIVGAEFNDSAAIAWFNGDPYHSTPLTLSLVLNTLYKEKFGPDKSISFINHPLPLSAQSQLDTNQMQLVVLQTSTIMAFGMAYLTSFYIIFCIKERVCKSKHLQFVSGVKVLIFWTAAFVCDLLTYLVTVVFILITLAACQPDGLQTAEELGRTTLVLFSLGFDVLPFVYLTAYMFNVPAVGYSRVMLFGMLTGLVGLVAVQVLEATGKHGAAIPIHWVLLFTPVYCLSKGVSDLSVIAIKRKLCAPWGSSACSLNEQCCGLDDFYSFDTPGIGGNLVIAFSMSALLFAILITNEFGFFSYILNRFINFSKPPMQINSEEDDVAEENNKIRSSSVEELNNTYSLVLRDVTKYYRNFLAVNSICLGVKPYECFGLLGVNGAGKTTTFKIMTGEEQITYGDALVKGLDIKHEQKKVQKLIGYCPQFDALLDDLTARETLQIFALVHGVPYSRCRSLGESLAKEYDFYKHLDKEVKELSGGTKRKLSTTLSLIGDPHVIYLDEPSTGMDPAAKRHLWTALAKVRDSGKCLVLTSHSMEECEALCTRIAIMVNGSFKCLGSGQHLKNKYAQGFSLTIKIRRTEDSNLDEEVARIDRYIQTTFPGAQQKEKYLELLSYQLVNSSLSWSKMFGILERSKKKFNIEDYVLGQCSLEQVFLSFTKHQQ